MATTKAEMATALGTDETTLDMMVGLVAGMREAGLGLDQLAAWVGTMALATANAKLEGLETAIAAADSAISSPRVAAVEAIQAARQRVDLARARINSGAYPEAEQAAATTAGLVAGQAVGGLATAMGAQAQALAAALGG